MPKKSTILPVLITCLSYFVYCILTYFLIYAYVSDRKDFKTFQYIVMIMIIFVVPLVVSTIAIFLLEKHNVKTNTKKIYASIQGTILISMLFMFIILNRFYKNKTTKTIVGLIFACTVWMVISIFISVGFYKLYKKL